VEHRLRITLIALSFLVVAHSVPAQKLPFGSYSIEDGLVDSVIFTMYQDSAGYLWIGTRAGVNRFDGHQFTEFTVQDGLAHNVIRDILEGGDGSLWFATERGVSRLKDGVLSSIGTEHGLPHKSARCLVEDFDGALWIGTYGGGICRLRGDEVEVFSTDDGLPHNKVRAAMRGRNGDLWFGTSGGGVCRYRNGEFRSYGRAEGLASVEVRCLWEDIQGVVWVGTRRGLYRQAGDRFEPAVADGPLVHQSVNTVSQDRQGRIWVGTREGGAFALSGDGVTRYRMAEGLIDDSIVSILEDTEGNLWFGTYGGGLARLSDERIRNFEAQSGFTYGNVYCIVEGRDGDLWFGSNGGGVSRFDGKSFSSYTVDQGLGHNKVVSALRDRNGSLWFGTLDGVSRWERERFVTYHARDGLAHDIVYDIAQDQEGALWFATFNGLTRLQDGVFETFDQSDGLGDNRVNNILVADDGTLWLGTANGVSRRVGDRFESSSIEEGLVSDFVNHLFEDTVGNLWVCTNSGLSRIAEDGITNYTTAEGLSHNSCTVGMQSRDGSVWIGTNRGINRYDGASFSVVTSKDGLVSDLVNRGAGYTDREGNLWFGTIGGVSRLDADFAIPSLPPPPVHLTEVRVRDQAVPNAANLVLAHDENYIKLEFTGISYRHARDLQFRYKLEGLDTDWQHSRQSTVQYTSLPPGRYTFSITARHSDGEWNEQPAQLSFKIVPPFWRRLWFLAVTVLFLTAGVTSRVWRLKRQTVELEKRVRDRTIEVESANEKLRWLALNDRLTNLRNRHYVYEIMPEEVTRLERKRRRLHPDGGGESLGVALVDIDFFKRVNDSYGNTVGDAVLAEVAVRLKTVTRDTDSVARWGGEEFLVLFRDASPHRLDEMAQRIVDGFRSHTVDVDPGVRVSLTCSVGYTHFPEALLAWEDIVKVADVALHEAKRAGRDRSFGLIYPSDADPDAVAAAIHANVRQAFEDGLLLVDS